jgi:curli biogenesis system outer membrane secretion channel CsgG
MAVFNEKPKAEKYMSALTRSLGVLCLPVLIMAIFAFPAHAKDNPGLKKRIAVMTFEDRSGSDQAGGGIADKLTTALVKSGKYIVLERREIQKMLDEQALGPNGTVTEGSAAKAGKVLGVELLVMGAITEFGQKESSVGGSAPDVPLPGPSIPFGMGGGDAHMTTATARVGIDLHIVNATTGVIVTAENVSEEESKSGMSFSNDEFSFSNQPGFDNTLAGKATHRTIIRIVDLISQSMGKVPWCGKIVKVNGDNTVYIKPGTEGGVKNGDIFVVYSLGEEIIDPDTNLPLSTVETKAGTVEVTDAKDKLAKAKISAGSGFKIGDLVREN